MRSRIKPIEHCQYRNAAALPDQIDRTRSVQLRMGRMEPAGHLVRRVIRREPLRDVTQIRENQRMACRHFGTPVRPVGESGLCCVRDMSDVPVRETTILRKRSDHDLIPIHPHPPFPTPLTTAFGASGRGPLGAGTVASSRAPTVQTRTMVAMPARWLSKIVVAVA